MDIVIDANVFEGFYKEAILHKDDHQLTDSPTKIFKRLGQEDITFFDIDGHIRSEWRNLVAPEWFDVWYPDLLLGGCAYEISVESCYQLRNQLRKLGFHCKKDFWYIKTAKSIRNDNIPIIITEDLDFFNPKMKKCNSKTRQKLLSNSCGPIANFLCKNENIKINSVWTYNKSTGC